MLWLFHPSAFACQERLFAEGREGHWNLAEIQGPLVWAGLEPNRLQIVAVGPQIAVYVNGEPAMFGTDPDFDERYKGGGSIW
jgi:hypothetical protein